MCKLTFWPKLACSRGVVLAQCCFVVFGDGLFPNFDGGVHDFGAGCRGLPSLELGQGEDAGGGTNTRPTRFLSEVI